MKNYLKPPPSIWCFRNLIAPVDNWQIPIKLSSSIKLSLNYVLLAKLVGGFNPSEKYESKWIISPSFGVKIRNIWVATTEKSLPNVLPLTFTEGTSLRPHSCNDHSRRKCWDTVAPLQKKSASRWVSLVFSKKNSRCPKGENPKRKKLWKTYPNHTPVKLFKQVCHWKSGVGRLLPFLFGR